MPKLSTQTILGIAYALVALIVAGLYNAGALDAALVSSGMKIPADVASFSAIALLAAAAIFMNASPMVVLSAGTFFGFFVLSIHQEEPLVRYLCLGAVLFGIGMYGMVTSRNAVRVLMSIELMLNAVNINLVAFARYVDPSEVKGQVFAIFILTVAAAEAAVGLAIVLAMYRNTSTVDMEQFNLLKW
jgi:NAD(P)H-quinone oxidoreductase subunit 4L